MGNLHPRLYGFCMSLAEQLSDAEKAYHDLMTGQQVVEVTDQNGERIKYGQANAFRLAAYIQDLKSKLNPVTSGTGPMRFWF